MRGLLGRPAVVAALTILAVCVPTSEQNASAAVTVTPADLGCVALVGVAGLRLLRGGWPPPGRLWLAFGLAGIGFALATMTAQDPATSLTGFVRYLEIFVVVPAAVVVVVRDRTDVALVCAALLAAGALQGVVGVWQYLTGTGASFAGQSVRAVGTFGALEIMGMATVVGYAIVVALGLAVALRGAARLGLLALAVALVGPLLLSLSRGALIATIVAAVLMVTLAVLRVVRRTVLLGAYGLLGLAAVLVAVLASAAPSAAAGEAEDGIAGRLASITTATSDPDRSVQDRYDLWSTALDMWHDYPYTGVGLKQFAAFRDDFAPMSLSAGSDVADASTSFRREPLLSPHNMYLLVLSEQGIIGAACFAILLLGLLTRAVRRTWRRGTTGTVGLAAVGILAWTMVSFTFGDIGGPTTILISVLLGLAASWAVPEGRPA